jgi:predicted MFS family arabinose efflux permease
VLPAILSETSISESQAGFAGSTFFLAYALASPVFAALTDKFRAKQLYLIGCGFALSGGLIFPWLGRSLDALVFSRIASGLGMAGLYMPGLRLLLQAVPPAHQQRTSALYTSSLALGLSVSFGVTGGLQLIFAWPAAFVAAACAAAMALTLVALVMPKRDVPSSQLSFFVRARAVLRKPGVGLVLLSSAGNSWEGFGFRTWWVTFLSFVATLPSNGSSKTLNFALATAFSGHVAMPVSALVAKLAESGQRYRVIACVGLVSVVTGLLLASMIHLSFWLVFVMSVLYICAIFADAGSLTPAMLVRVEPEERGAALALLAMAASTAACVVILLSGLVIEALGGLQSVLAWQGLIVPFAFGSAVTAFAMWRLGRLR